MNSNRTDILALLKEKNLYLEKFLQESRNEKLNFKMHQFENLPYLYKKREEIILNIQSIYRRINKQYMKVFPQGLTGEEKKESRKIFNQIRENIHSIMNEDLEIISYIENEKTKIIKEICQSTEGRRALNSYKS